MADISIHTPSPSLRVLAQETVDAVPTDEKRGMVAMAIDTGGTSRTYNMNKKGSTTKRDAMNKRDGMIRSEEGRGRGDVTGREGTGNIEGTHA